MNVSGERTFAAPRQAVWDVLNDPASMAKTMPGVQSFDVHDAERWTANVKIPLGLGGLKMKIDMTKTEERAPEFAKLRIKGTGVGAMLSMETSFALADVDGGTSMQWAADVKLAGPVGSMGQRVLQPIVNQQVQHVLKALEAQVDAAVATGTGESSGGEGSAGQGQAPATGLDLPPAEGPTDYGRPADTPPDAEPPSGTSGADEGVSPWSPEAYEADPQGPTTSTEDEG